MTGETARMGILDLFKLENRVSIVTGGSRGLGKAMAAGLAEAGSHIVIADIDKDEADRTAEAFRALGVRALSIRTDVTNEEQVREMTDKVLAEFGSIDVLVNNAGIALHEKTEDLSFGDWNRVIDLNLNSVFLVSREVGKVMIRQRKGSIINIASMSALIANTPQPQSAYNASKSGVIMLTKSLASEWAQHNIRVNAIAPGYMKTALTKPFFEEGGDMVKRWMEMTPLGRPGNPEELAGIALYLASDASSFATGSVFTIDGGYTAW